MTRTLVIGAAGFVGGHVARHLAESGHDVHGVVRTDDAAQRLQDSAITPVLGDLDGRLGAVVEAARESDVVVYAAQPDPPVERASVTALLDALDGSGSTFVFTSGSGVLMQRTDGAWSPDSFAEDDPFVTEPLAAVRREVEELAISRASSVRTLVMRPGMIWGEGAHGHLEMIDASVDATGTACYIGHGLNVYAGIHIDDVCDLYAQAIDRGTTGHVFHAVAGEVPTRWIAEHVAAARGVDVRSVSPAEAVDVFGKFGALIAGACSRIRPARTHTELGWSPRHTDLLLSR